AGRAVVVKPEKSVTADGRGSARLENAWVLRRYRILATSPRALDYLSDELEPRESEEIRLRGEMIVIASVSASGGRPALGKFKVLQADQTSAGAPAPGGPAVRERP